MKQIGTTAKAFALLGALCMTLASAGCGNDPQSEARDNSNTPKEPINVVTSINQWGTLAQQIGGDDVKVTSIVNTVSTDAHDFEPQASDIAKLQSATIVLVNGAGYDEWASKAIKEGTASISAADASDVKTGDNPHLWFSKDARNATATALEQAFTKAKPSKAKQFENRLKAWKDDEVKIESAMNEFSQKHKDVTYAATEPVAQYLMNDLGFTDKTPEGYAKAIGAEGEPAPSDLQEFQLIISNREINLLINNTQEANNTTNLLTGTAGRTQIPVVDVSEQMPEDQKTLTGWIITLISSIDKAMTDFETSTAEHQKTDTNSDGNKQSPSTTDHGSAPSNEGQTDPGK